MPIVVAVNKMDKPDARPEVVMRDLATEGLQSEEWGGETQFFKVSAQTGEGIDELLEACCSRPRCSSSRRTRSVPAEGVVLEAYLDKGRGPVANVLVQDGTLSTGNVVVAGCGVRQGPRDDRRSRQAGRPRPARRRRSRCSACPRCPTPATRFYVVTDVQQAQEIAERRKKRAPESTIAGRREGRPRRAHARR